MFITVTRGVSLGAPLETRRREHIVSGVSGVSYVQLPYRATITSTEDECGEVGSLLQNRYVWMWRLAWKDQSSVI